MTARAGRRIGLLPACLSLSVVVFAQATGWQANPRVVTQASAERPGINYVEDRVPPYTLPDPLATTGAAVTSPAEWQRLRRAILELFREHVYGRAPGRADRVEFQHLEDASAMDGAAALRRIAVVSRQTGLEHRFEITMFLPTGRRGPVPIFLLINNRPGRTRPADRVEPGFWPAEQMIARGYGMAAIQNSELAADDNDHFREGVIRLFEGTTTTAPRPSNAWAALAAWAWGARRAMDYFETDPRIDAKRVAVIGHSRGGKAALWAGAEDERFALVISNESGEGGAALSRRAYGETLERLTTTFPHWFAANYATFATRVHALPVDQHMLMALVAPRLLYVASADEDLWSDPRGEFLSLAHASPVYGLWGDRPIRPADMPPLDQALVVDRRAYHIRTGGHNLTPYDWDRFADFADARWGTAVTPR